MLTVDSTESVLRYVSAGLGVGVVSHLAAKPLLERGIVQAVTVEGWSASFGLSCDE